MGVAKAGVRRGVEERAGSAHALASLRHRDFRLLWLGQVVSIMGDQMQTIGIAWHVYVLTSSPLQLGLLGLFRAGPFMAFSLLGGAAADSVDRKRLLIFTQVSQMALTGGLVIASATEHVTVWLLYGVTLLSGAASAFDSPARQAILPNLVPRAELANAMNLTTLMRRIAMIAGPGVGGLVIGAYGLAWNYFGNAVSFLAVVVAVLALGPVPQVPLPPGGSLDRLLGGLRFARGEPLVILPMLLDFITRGCGSVGTLLPIFARDIYNVGPEGLGWLSSAMSAGAVAGGLFLGGRREIRHPLAVMMAAYIAEGLVFAGLALAPLFGAAVAVLFLKGIVNVFGEVLRITVLQLRTPDEVRGRVTALSGMFDIGGPQFGQLEAGSVAEAIGPVGAALTSGLAAAAISVGFALAPGLRRRLLDPAHKLAGPG